MPSKFDTSITDLIEVCEGMVAFSDVKRTCVVRDLKGRVRQVVDAPDSLDLDQLEKALCSRMDMWFEGPVLNARSNTPAEKKLALTLLERATDWPAGWPRSRKDPTGADIKIDSIWRGYQRALSKQAWLAGLAKGGMWPLCERTPAILAFYSFKGGVGRSTLMGIIAWQLARVGRRVVCIDLDLEAPGLVGLFGIDDEDAVIDHLLAHAATGRAPATDPVTWTKVHEAEIGVVPAGRMDRSYLEKLGRLDYLGMATADESPVAKALQDLLKRIKKTHNPDYILLDCRAGLHDLGGLSLTDLAHVDVLVGRDTPQGREGLALTLEVLGTRRPPPSQRILIAQTMVPLPPESEVAKATTSRFRAAMYKACEDTIYKSLDDEPAEEDDGVAHYPWPVGLYDEIASCENLREVSRSLLDSDVFRRIRSRIEALALPESESEPKGATR